MIVKNDAWELLGGLKENSVDLVLTDPPYGLDSPATIMPGTIRKTSIDMNFEWDDKIPLRQLVHEIARVLKRSGHAVIFFNHRNYSHILDYGEEVGLTPRDPIVYNKTNPAPRVRKVGPMPSLEFAAWLTKSPISVDTYNWQLSQRITNCFTAPIPNGEGSPDRHPTQKPLIIGLWLVALLTRQNGVVVDPFAGAGTFPVAAYLLNRDIAWAESDEHWRAVAERRIEDAPTSPVCLRIMKRFRDIIFEKDKFMNDKDDILGLAQRTLYEG